MFNVMNYPIELSAEVALCPLEMRLKALDEGKKNILFIRNEVDYGTYRYRAHNMAWHLNTTSNVYGMIVLVSELEECYRKNNFLDLISAVIFVRTQWSPESMRFIKLLKMRKIPCYYDIDDLVYSDQYVETLSLSLNCRTQHELNYWSGYIHTCARIFSECKAVICTNDYLASQIQRDTGKPVFIIPNYMNPYQIQVSEALTKIKKSQHSSSPFLLGYFPGTGSHDKDFEMISDAVLKFMTTHPDVMLKVVGFLNFPKAFEPMIQAKRVIKKDLTDYLSLQKEIAEVDINLIPLQDNVFTRAKSELKFFEAGICRTVSFATPLDVYRKCIAHKLNGFLCSSFDDWLSSFEKFYSNQELAEKNADNAYTSAREMYCSDSERIRSFIDKVYFSILHEHLQYSPTPVSSITSNSRRSLPKRLNSIIHRLSFNGIKYFGKKPYLNTDSCSSQIPKEKNKKQPSCEISQFLYYSWGALQSFPIEKNINMGPRINIIYSDFFASAFFGGMATSLHFVIRYALRKNAILRIITLDTPAREEVFENFLKIHHLPRPKQVQYYFRNLKDENLSSLDVSPEDIFIATFWITGDVLLNSSLPNRKILFVQDVEPYFYCYGDEHLRCSKVFSSKEFLPIVNTKLLHDYYVREGIENFKKRGKAFEPAFPYYLYAATPNTFVPHKTKKMFVYLRKNSRNIHLFTLAFISEIIQRNILSENQWEIYFAGDDSFPALEQNSITIYNLGILSWEEYSQLASQIDLAISFMYTPHPSYPPLDLAASGAVVLTNTYKNKKSLAQYSKNILTAPLEIEALVLKLREALALVEETERRKYNYAHSCLQRSWDEAFKPIFRYLDRCGY